MATAIPNQIHGLDATHGKLKGRILLEEDTTCASTDGHQFFDKSFDKELKSEPLSDSESSDSADVHPIEARSFLSCLDLPEIVRTLYNFDWGRLMYSRILLQSVMHYLAYCGFKAVFMGEISLNSIAFHLAIHFMGALGVTAGMHRLWAHRTYKAHRSIHYLLMIMSTLATQNSVFEWSRDHRTHHKHAETDADPHNAHSGFFFSHMGWLLVKKHPDVATKGKKISVKDLEKDGMLMWQHRNYIYLVGLLCFAMPTFIPMYFFGESFWNAYCLSVTRIMITLHATWCVNSLAHWWGDYPIDATIYPVENLFVSLITVGEGWHNYHHAFPNDYRASHRQDSLLLRLFFNPTHMFIDGLAMLGLVWSRTRVSDKIVKSHCDKYGEAVLRNKN